MAQESKYELHPRANWAIRELIRRIEEDFKNPEVEAEFQKWKEEQDRANQTDETECADS